MGFSSSTCFFAKAQQSALGLACMVLYVSCHVTSCLVLHGSCVALSFLSCLSLVYEGSERAKGARERERVINSVYSLRRHAMYVCIEVMKSVLCPAWPDMTGSR